MASAVERPPSIRASAVMSSQIIRLASQNSQPANGVSPSVSVRAVVRGAVMIRRTRRSRSERLTTFWEACSRVSQRPGETHVSQSLMRHSSATRITAAPAVAWVLESRLPATARATCQLWARAQLGRLQKVSSSALRRGSRAICRAAQVAARRSASLPAGRRPAWCSCSVSSVARDIAG
jgi:hypothetical protein